MPSANAYKLDVKDVEEFLGMMDDVGAGIGVLVCPSGYTEAAKRRANAGNLKCHVVSVEEANELNLLAEARQIYPWDWTFHSDMGRALKALRVDSEPSIFILALQEVPFDEWEGLLQYALWKHPDEARSVLEVIAGAHCDDGWRYNAVRLLGESGLITIGVLLALGPDERDGETVELILELLDTQGGDQLLKTVAKAHSQIEWRIAVINFLGSRLKLSQQEIITMAENEPDPDIRATLASYIACA